ncbi:hypothetical protein BJ165DRAFT_443639 [Panaeolus papilionaceus]|nr:hypothetical protein BJ165DRAFT_443639 [Panaeolus papilionaceus]
MYQFLSTRSGKPFNFTVSPIWTPPTFQLSKLLEQAVALNNDETCCKIDDCARSCSTYREDSFGSNKEFGSYNGVEEKSLLGQGGNGAAAAATEEDDLEEGEIRGDSNDMNHAGKPLKRKQRYRQAQKAKRFKLGGDLPSGHGVLKQIGGDAKVVLDVDLSQVPLSRGSNGLKSSQSCNNNSICSLDELRAEGYKVIEYTPGVSHPIIDSTSEKIFAVVVGTIDDPTYLDSAKKAFEFLDEVSPGIEIPDKEANHHRRDFAAVSYGVSYGQVGQGPKVPHCVSCPNDELVQKVFSNEHIKRLGTFASYAFSMWAPKLFNYYQQKIALLRDKMPSLLKWTFYNTIWLCTTINLGPHVCCLPRRDSLDVPFEWCAITALGDFDYKKGGHLVLHDLKIAIEFPPGSLILIPSALLNYASTLIQPGERRMSFTQICSGGLFRFIENGFRSEKTLEKEDREAYANMMKAKEGKQDMGIGLWSTLGDLLAPATPAPT